MRTWLLSFITILLLSSTSQALTEYYVDPDWGGTENCTEAEPCVDLVGQWSRINTALASDAVTVYFSAREAAGDTNQANTTTIILKRTDDSTNLFTIDGCSKYNTDDATPSWATYSGTSKFLISGATTVSITSQPTGVQDYVAIDCFKPFDYENQQAIFFKGGNTISLRNTDVDCNDDAGKSKCGGIIFPDVASATNQSSGVVIENNTIQDVRGEHLYVSGNSDTACSEYRHNDIQILNNIIGPGSVTPSGADQDGIDVKDCWQSVTVSGNTINGVDQRCITTHSPGLYEKNTTSDCKSGLRFSTFWDGDGEGLTGETIIRNNVMYNSSEVALRISGDANQGDITGTMYLYNNSINTTTGASKDCINISAGLNMTISDVQHFNNISANCTGDAFDFVIDGTLTNEDGDYNDYWGTVSTYTRGANGLNVDPLFTSSTDLTLQSGSPMRDVGVTIAGFTEDHDGVVRPQNVVWDIGAFEFPVSSVIPAISSDEDWLGW